MKEEQGIPVAIVGIEVEDKDALTGRIENILRDTVVPRIHLKIEFIPINSDNTGKKYVLILHIPQSLNRPHARRNKHKHYDFYLRNSNGKNPMDYLELKNAFVSSYVLNDTIKSFVNNRIMEIQTNGIPISTPENFNLFEYPIMILHFIPVGAFSDTIYLDPYRVYKFLEEENKRAPIMKKDGTLQDPSPLMLFTNNLRYNLEGLQYPFWNNRYYQFYRNGIIEKITIEMAYKWDGRKYIDGYNAEYYIVRSIEEFFIIATKFEIPVPFMLFISFVNTKESYMVWLERSNPDYTTNKEYLLLPEIFIEDYEFDLKEVLRIPINTLWNAFGYAYSPCHPPEGKEKHKNCSIIYDQDD